MTHFGDPGLWADLVDSQVPDILLLVLEAWNGMPDIASDAKEDPVSEELCRQLRHARNRCDLPFRIDTQLVELDPAADEDQGRMDIVFSPMVPRETLYFALECKRINVLTKEGKIRPYFSAYVRFGMARFVSGQYASQVRNGGMLAFVLNDDISSAIAGVNRNIRINANELGMGEETSLEESSILRNDHRARETFHIRQLIGKPIRIHHLFLPVTRTG